MKFTQEDEAKLLVDIYLHSQSLIAKYSRDELLEASFVATDLQKLIERAQLFISEKLKLQEKE